jgi:hypothetical protein
VKTATQIGVEAVFYTALAFTAAVSCFWPWWKSQLGWTIVAKSLALAVATLPAMLFYWYSGRSPAWLDWVSVCALWSIPVILAWRAYVLWQVQRSGGQPL